MQYPNVYKMACVNCTFAIGYVLVRWIRLAEPLGASSYPCALCVRLYACCPGSAPLVLLDVRLAAGAALLKFFVCALELR